MTISPDRVGPEVGQDDAEAGLAEVGFVLHDLGRLMRKRFEQRATPLGFTRSQWLVLLHLAKVEGIHQAGLAEILEMEPITLVRILDRLEARGLVERRPRRAAQDAGRHQGQPGRGMCTAERPQEGRLTPIPQRNHG